MTSSTPPSFDSDLRPARAPASLRANVLALTGAVPSRTRRQGRRRAALAFTVAVVPSPVLFEAWGGLRHSEGRPFALTAGVAAGAAALAIVCVVVAWGRGGSMLGRSAAALAVPPLVFPWLTLAWLSAFHARYVEPFARFGTRCLAMSLLCGGGVLAAAIWLRRGTAVRTAPLAGGALGMMASAFAAVLVDLWCPLTNMHHVLVGHVLPIVVLTALGAGLGTALLGLRARPR